MEDLSKGAFLPWNRKERNMIAKIAEKNREIGIAEFKDGKEFEPNPIKRMLEKVKQRKLGKGKEQEVEIEEVNEEDVQYIRVLLHQTSVQNKEISVQIKAVVENDGRMYKLKLHTLWSPLKKDGYIGIVGYFDIVKKENSRIAGIEEK